MKRIGLAQIDGKWANLALMKLSAWYRARGDTVEPFMPLGAYDKVYASKTFAFTPDSEYLPEGTIKGGTGYDLTTELPPEVESMMPDYSLYPSFTSALGFTTRGCVRRCPFCVVPQKEGGIHIVGDLYSFWAGQKEVILLDNNLTAAPMEHFKAVMTQFVKEKVKVDFSQGLDLRLTTDEHARLLKDIRLSGQIHFAWDNVRDEQAVRDGIALVARSMPLSRIMLLVLIGYDSTPEEDMHRIEVLRGLGVDSFVMPFNKKDKYQRQFARWVNHKAIFKTVAWRDYHK